MAIKRQLIILLAALLFAILALLGLRHALSVPRMTVYQGKTAQQWLGEFFTTNQMQAYTAFREMGSNALPVIVQAFAKQDSAWDRFYQRYYPDLPPAIKNRLTPPLPDLERWSAANFATLNMRYARAAVPDFTRILAQGNTKRRLYILSALINFLTPADTNSVPALIVCLQSSDTRVQQMAALGVERIGPAAKAAVPALTAVINNSDGKPGGAGPDSGRVAIARALWKIDNQTNTAVTVFKAALNSSDAHTRGWAAIYLTEIQPNDLSLIPVLIELLQGKDQGLQMSAAYVIGNYHTDALAAVPELTKIIDAPRQFPELRRRALASLKMIDPIAAAKYEHP